MPKTTKATTTKAKAAKAGKVTKTAKTAAAKPAKLSGAEKRAAMQKKLGETVKAKTETQTGGPKALAKLLTIPKVKPAAKAQHEALSAAARETPKQPAKETPKTPAKEKPAKRKGKAPHDVGNDAAALAPYLAVLAAPVPMSFAPDGSLVVTAAPAPFKSMAKMTELEATTFRKVRRSWYVYARAQNGGVLPPRETKAKAAATPKSNATAGEKPAKRVRETLTAERPARAGIGEGLTGTRRDAITTDVEVYALTLSGVTQFAVAETCDTRKGADARKSPDEPDTRRVCDKPVTYRVIDATKGAAFDCCTACALTRLSDMRSKGRTSALVHRADCATVDTMLEALRRNVRPNAALLAQPKAATAAPTAA